MDTVILSEAEEALLQEALDEIHQQDDNKLPVNSNILLVDETTSRFSSAEWFSKIQSLQVLLAGLGGIGSFVAFLLSRTNIGRLIVYDNDVVDNTNLSGQFYEERDVGTTKTMATVSNLQKFSNYYNIQTEGEYKHYSIACPIMIGAFDNMSARKILFNNWKNFVSALSEEHKKNCLFIDGRLAAEEFQVFCIKGTDDFLINKYEQEWLFNEDQAETTLCSYKQTSYCANMIASVIVNLVVNFAANLCNPLIERELPFYTNYDAQRMYFKTEL